MKQRNLSVQQAMDEVGIMAKGAIADFDTYKKLIPSWGEAIDKQIDIAIRAAQNWFTTAAFVS